MIAAASGNDVDSVLPGPASGASVGGARCHRGRSRPELVMFFRVAPA